MTLQSDGQRVKRSYQSPRRAAQAEATRHAILDAAQQLFSTRGYQGTSIRAVAEAADVSEQTVYNGFRDKPSLLFAVGERIVSGAAAAASPPRDFAEEIGAESDPHRRIEIGAAWARTVWEQGMLDFESMLLDAAASDPRAADVAAAAWQQKFQEDRQAFDLIFPAGTLPAGLDRDHALDLFFAMDSAAFVRILIKDRGWSFDQFEHELAGMLARVFVDPSD